MSRRQPPPVRLAAHALLRRWRTWARLSQAQAADVVGLHVSTYAAAEKDRGRFLTYPQVRLFCAAVGMTTRDREELERAARLARLAIRSRYAGEELPPDEEPKGTFSSTTSQP